MDSPASHTAPQQAPRPIEARPIEASKRLDILIGHYDKSADLVQAAKTQRDRLFLWLLVLLVVELFAAVHPEAAQTLALAALALMTRGSRGDVSQLDFSVVNLFAYALLVYLLLNYYQRFVYVRSYLQYLDRLERLIGTLIGSGLIIREGSFYRAHRGRVHKSVRFFYEWMFHGLLVSVLLLRLWTERPQKVSTLSATMYGAQLLMSFGILYFSAQHLLDQLSPQPSAALDEPELLPPVSAPASATESR